MSEITKPVALDETLQGVKERLGEIRNILGSNRGGTIYGFHINPSESDPEDAVTYLADAVGMTPAAMNFTSGVFNWGSWHDAFFLPKPCMLKYDGTVDYYLEPSDYTKKLGGGSSDVANTAYGGNAMMEWGQNGKKIWYKIAPDSTPTGASIYIADYQVDDGYHAWSFVNNQGRLVEHFYTPIYNGTIVSGKLRSISGLAYSDLCQGKTAAQEIELAEANNPTGQKLWYTETYADITLINLLLILVSKTLNSQGAFGNGRCGQTSAVSSMLGTGTLNDKGLFFGSNGNTSAVKVFGMENWWGNQWRRYAGHMFVDRVNKFKMTRGTEDGSTATDYNTTGNGYLTGATGPSTNNFVTACTFGAVGTMFTSAVGGTDATYYCDYFYQDAGTRYPLLGAGCNNGAGSVGAFSVSCSDAPDYTYWCIGAAPSCKPLS